MTRLQRISADQTRIESAVIRRIRVIRVPIRQKSARSWRAKYNPL